MRIHGVNLRPKRSTLRVLHALGDARSVSTELQMLRSMLGWVLVKFNHPGPSRTALLRLPDVQVLIDTSRAELIPYIEIWHEHSYDKILGFSPDIPELVVDVGANIGAYTLYQLVRKHAQSVIAFEPAPTVYPRLQQNLHLNGFTNVRAIQAAVGDICGMVSFAERPLSGNSHISDAGTPVPIVTLDSIVQGRHVDLLKIDTEGFELPVLRGSLDTLSRTDRIVIEIHAESDAPVFMEILKPFGFRFLGRRTDILYYAR